MTGSKTTFPAREAVLAALTEPPLAGYFKWDGKDEDERPLSKAELREGMTAFRRSRGRPSGATKEQVAIRLDRDVLAALRATGKGWQTRVNEVMREWLKTRSVTP